MPSATQSFSTRRMDTPSTGGDAGVEVSRAMAVAAVPALGRHLVAVRAAEHLHLGGHERSDEGLEQGAR